MKKMILSVEKASRLGLLWHDLVLQEVDLNVPDDLEIVDLIELYLDIESSLAFETRKVVQFVGATAGFGGEQIALDLSWAATSVLGKKVFLLDCSTFLCRDV